VIELNDTIRLVALQFSFLNPGLIPVSMKRKRLNRETQEELVERKSHSSGVMVIEPTERCSLLKFPMELEEAGYEMVGALYEERINYKNPSGGTYHMVRFLFARHEFAGFSEDFKKARDVACVELQRICEIALWRVRAFSNPFYKNGEEIAAQRAISINFELPVLLWRQPKVDHRLRVIENVIKVM